MFGLSSIVAQTPGLARIAFADILGIDHAAMTGS